MGEAVFRQAKGQNEILAENFTGMNGGVFSLPSDSRQSSLRRSRIMSGL
jgi:hypothetical protein